MGLEVAGLQEGVAERLRERDGEWPALNARNRHDAEAVVCSVLCPPRESILPSCGLLANFLCFSMVAQKLVKAAS